MKRYQSCSSAETKKIAAALAKEISVLPPRSRAKGGRKGGAVVITLSGELGAGKTTFVQGFVRGLRSRARVASPTFILVRRTKIRAGRFSYLFHIDAYRLKSAGSLAALDFKKILADPRHIVLIEWPERISRALPRKRISIKLSHGRREHERELKIVDLI